jgi:hypothetical protein
VKTQGQLCGLSIYCGGVNIRGQDASRGLWLAPRRGSTYDFTHIVDTLSSKLLRGIDLMTG